MSDPKKSDPLATHIADDVITQALESVERRGQQEAGAVEIKVEPAAAEGGEGAGTDEAARLKADLLEARQALRAREAELEASQAMNRGTMEKLREGHERLLRATADLENYKKRAVREREESAKFGQERLLREMLPVLDNLERALEHAAAKADFEGLRTGVEMTRKLFESTLGKFGVTGYSSLGQPFDPNLHEAMQAVESDASPGTVVQEMVRGFKLHDRLMRPAMVVVARARVEPAAEPPAEPPAEQPAGDQAGAPESVKEGGSSADS